MSGKYLSPAKERVLRHKQQGKDISVFDFKLDMKRAISADDYYDIQILQEEKDSLLSQYVKINKNLEDEFYKRTKLDLKDISFLLLATALQCVRQYFLTDFKARVHHEYTKKSDKMIEKNVSNALGDSKEGIGKQGGYYYQDLNSIIMNGVPYDKIVGGGINGKFGIGLGGSNHRYKTLGHDPILGWVIGPMNIMTKTLTTNSFGSYHIRGNSIASNANNGKLLEASYNRIKMEPISFVASIIKQAIHFNSDLYTKHSLPIPIIQTYSPRLAAELSKDGIDCANLATIGKQATYSMLINSIISIIHGLFFQWDSEENKQLFKVKTKKILLYSNTLATASNAIYVAMTAHFNKMDIGGAIVTLYRIVKDEKFIRDVMQEFIDSETSSYYTEELEKVSFEHNQLINELGLNQFST